MILLGTGGKNGGGYEASKYVVIAFHAGILLLHAALNSLPISWLSLFGQLAAAWNVLGTKILFYYVLVVLCCIIHFTMNLFRFQVSLF